MAVRAGEMWELSEGRVWDEAEVDEKKQGCPACCGREQGWAWETGEDGSRAWRHRGGERRVEATAQHMICGQCTGDGAEGGAEERDGGCVTGSEQGDACSTEEG